MKKKFIFLAKIVAVSAVALFSTRASAQYNLEWAKEYVASDGYHTLGDVTYDMAGNYYSWGFFQDSIRVNFESSGFDLGSSGQSVYIAKYNTNGELIWAKLLDVDGANSYVNHGALKVDAQGNIYAYGRYAAATSGAQMDINPGSEVTLFPALPPTGQNSDFSFILKLDSNGNFLWVKEILGASALGDLSSRHMDIDAEGNIYVAADYTTIVNFGAPQNIAFSNTSKSFYLAKYTGAGDFVWAKEFAGAIPTSFLKQLTSLVVQNENLYISGWYYGNLDLNPGADVDTLSSVAEAMSFIVQLDTAGTYVFAKRLIGSGNYINDLAVDATGNIYAVGEFYGTVDFDPNAGVTNLVSVGAANDSDAFLMKLNNTGELSWAKRVGADGYDLANACTIDNNGKLLVTGIFSGDVDFDPGNGVAEQEGIAEIDCFLLRLDADGNYETSHVWGGDMFDYAFGIFQDNDNNILIHGNNGSTNMDYSGIERGGPSGLIYLMKISPDNSVSVDELTLDSGVLIFPNPASDQFQIKDLENGTQIKISDISGRVVYSGTANNNLMIVSTQDWSNGLYLIQTELNGAVQKQKLMVSK